MRPSKHKLYLEHYTFGLRQALRLIEHEAPKREYSFVRFHRCVFMCCHWCIWLTSWIIMTNKLKLPFNLLLITIINWWISQVAVALCSQQTRIASCQQRRDSITVVFFVNFCYSSTKWKIRRHTNISKHVQYSSLPAFISIPLPWPLHSQDLIENSSFSSYR